MILCLSRGKNSTTHGWSMKCLSALAIAKPNGCHSINRKTGNHSSRVPCQFTQYREQLCSQWPWMSLLQLCKQEASDIVNEKSQLSVIDHLYKNRTNYLSLWISHCVMIVLDLPLLETSWNFWYYQTLRMESLNGEECNATWKEHRWIYTKIKLCTTYGWAQAVTPVECGLTPASHSHQNPKQILQSPQIPQRWKLSHGAHVGVVLDCQNLFGHCTDVQDHSGQGNASSQSPLAPGSPVPQCLSSPLPGSPPILLSPSRHTAHPGLPALALPRCSVLGETGSPKGSLSYLCCFNLAVKKNQCGKFWNLFKNNH